MLFIEVISLFVKLPKIYLISLFTVSISSWFRMSSSCVQLILLAFNGQVISSMIEGFLWYIAVLFEDQHINLIVFKGT